LLLLLLLLPPLLLLLLPPLLLLLLLELAHKKVGQNQVRVDLNGRDQFACLSDQHDALNRWPTDQMKRRNIWERPPKECSEGSLKFCRNMMFAGYM
jgi:hypothetical protein